MEQRGTTSAGITLALVGFSSSFAVVLQGLRAVGASPAQAASGLVALCIAQAIGMWALAYRYRMPITLAWSTPGAALLVTTGAASRGWPTAVGAFATVGVLLLVTALWPALGRLVSAIPAPLAQAMLAGVLFELCLAPVRSLAAAPAYVVPLIVLWLVISRWRPAWASPLVFAAALAIILTGADRSSLTSSDIVPAVDLTAPQFDLVATMGLALPLYLVTMASQNLPGAAVMSSYGYRVPWRPSLTVTGVGTVLASLAGGHAVNLAAITAALAAAPDAHPDPARRWRASVAAAWTYLVLALLAPALVVLAAHARPGILESVAGLALLGTFASAASAATSDAGTRLPAIITFLVAASGATLLHVGAPFWALVAGCLSWPLLVRNQQVQQAGARDPAHHQAPATSGVTRGRPAPRPRR